MPMMTFWAYIIIVLGIVVWGLMVPFGKRLSDNTMRAITVFGGAFLLAVCCLELLPEATAGVFMDDTWLGKLPFVAILIGFLLQQVLDGLSAHAEHGHTEDGYTIGGLMLGLCLHAFLEGMPLVQDGQVNKGLLWGIVVHNIPVAILLVGLMTARGHSFGRILLLLFLFAIMSPLGSLCCSHLIQPAPRWQCFIDGLVVGVLLHVSSSILFDHKRNHFSWLNLLLILLAFVSVYFIV